MTKPDYSTLLAAGLDLAPVSEITQGLWQGMRPATYIGYDLVVSCEQFLAKKPMEGYEGATVHVPLVDDDEFPLESVASQIMAAASAAVSILADHGKVLVHCSGGLNRSSLVTVETLVAAYGWERREAVTVLRAMRDKFCLCNRAFERWALREFLPTAETSAFRARGPQIITARSLGLDAITRTNTATSADLAESKSASAGSCSDGEQT